MLYMLFVGEMTTWRENDNHSADLSLLPHGLKRFDRPPSPSVLKNILLMLKIK